MACSATHGDGSVWCFCLELVPPGTYDDEWLLTAVWLLWLWLLVLLLLLLLLLLAVVAAAAALAV